jgi:glycosyltransferase involved in cell wall biosynthesis
VSEHDRAYYSAAGAAERAILVPNGVDDEFFDIPLTSDKEYVLFFGLLNYRPNYDGVARFLAEWPRVAAARPLARLRLAGAYPPEWLIKRARELERVDVLGFVDDLTSELAASRLVIVPLWQGGGTRFKVIEAMAAGRPIVSTFLGVEGLGFRSGEHGECTDDPSDLAVHTISLLEQPERASTMGLSARSHAHRFRWAEVTRDAERLYGRLAQETR